MSTTLKPRAFIKGHGGKFLLMQRWIRPMLPDTAVWFEACSATLGGILGNLRPAPHEHACDLDLRLYNLFQVLKHQGDEFARIIHSTPYHEQVYGDAWETMCLWQSYQGDQLFPEIPGMKPEPTDLELAVAYFILSWMGRDHSARSKSFATVRNNVGGGHNRAKNFANMDRIEYARDRLRAVTWYNCDMMEKLDFFDVEIGEKEREKSLRGTMIYIDPPYMEAGRKLYRYWWTPGQHAHFIERILKIEHAYVAISMDDNELYRDRLLPAGWDMQSTQARTQSNSGSMATEILWRNPACVAEWERQRKRGKQKNAQEAMQLWQE